MPVPKEAPSKQSNKIVWIGIGAGAAFGVVMSIAAALDGVSQNAIPGGAMLGMSVAYFVLYVKWEVKRPARRGRPIDMSRRLRPTLLIMSGMFGVFLPVLVDDYFFRMTIFWIACALLLAGVCEAFYRLIRLR